MKKKPDWTDMYGREWKIQNMEDSHIANCLYHCLQTNRADVAKRFKKEAGKRHLSQDFLNMAPIPHRNPMSGGWETIDHKYLCVKYLSPSKCKI